MLPDGYQNKLTNIVNEAIQHHGNCSYRKLGALAGKVSYGTTIRYWISGKLKYPLHFSSYHVLAAIDVKGRTFLELKAYLENKSLDAVLFEYYSNIIYSIKDIDISGLYKVMLVHMQAFIHINKSVLDPNEKNKAYKHLLSLITNTLAYSTLFKLAQGENSALDDLGVSSELN